MLTRSRLLDDAAAVDEKAATELAGRLAAMRSAAKTARDRADRATPEERELMGARADDLEADVPARAIPRPATPPTAARSTAWNA